MKKLDRTHPGSRVKPPALGCAALEATAPGRISPPRGAQVRSASSAEVQVEYLNMQEPDHTRTSCTWTNTNKVQHLLGFYRRLQSFVLSQYARSTTVQVAHISRVYPGRRCRVYAHSRLKHLRSRRTRGTGQDTKVRSPAGWYSLLDIDFQFRHRLRFNNVVDLGRAVSHQHEALQPCLLRPTKLRARFPLAAPFLPISLRLPYSMLRPGASIFNVSPRFFPFSFPLFPFPHTFPASWDFPHRQGKGRAVGMNTDLLLSPSARQRLSPWDEH
jgi:hypothetical protein